MSKLSKSPDARPLRLPSARRAGKVSRRLLIAGLILAVLAAGLVVGGRKLAHKDKGTQTAGEQFWKVQRGPMVISLVAPGSIKARNTTEIKCRLEGRDTKIIWIVEEGAIVKAGDKLVELESSGLKEDYIRQQISVATAKAAHEGAVQDLEIQKSKNRTDQVITRNKLEMAQLDLEKYKEGDYKQKLAAAESDIKLAEAQLKRAKDKLEGTQKLLAKGYVNRGELEADQLDVTKQQIELDKARNQKDLLVKYEYKRETSRLETEIEGAQQELERTKRSGESELQNKKTAVEAAKRKLDLEEFQMANLKLQLENSVIYAPQGGMVVYSQENRWGNDERIQAGVQVRNQQKLIDLPDFSSWQVEVRVHESRIQQVKLGQRASVAIDAFGGQALAAEVAKIGVLPDGSRWYMPDTKEYIVSLDLTTTTLPLKPGMTAKTEILFDTLRDVLYAPIQAVATLEGKAVVWRKGELGAQPQEVVVGLNNERFVELRSGVREGDVLLMQSAESGAGIFGKRAGEDDKDKKDGKAKDKDKDGEEKRQDREGKDGEGQGDGKKAAPAEREQAQAASVTARKAAGS